MDEILYLNGKRVRVRTCNHVFSERLAVISHGRYTPLLPHVSASVNRMDISVHWYVRHGETISNHNVIKIFELLGGSLEIGNFCTLSALFNQSRSVTD